MWSRGETDQSLCAGVVSRGERGICSHPYRACESASSSVDLRSWILDKSLDFDALSQDPLHVSFDKSLVNNSEP